MKISRNYTYSGLVILFHLVGLTGFLSPGLSSLFIKLVPWHLLLMLMLVIVSQTERNRYFGIFLVITYIAGFLIELIGIHTGLVFGSYSYGSTLGVKIAATPVMIGVNWILVIYSAGMLHRRLAERSRILAAGTGAALVTLLDWLIEPVAVHFDYWSWHSENIPLQNYIGWFLLSFCLLFLFYRLPFRKDNPVGVVLFIAQFAFFLILRFCGID